MNYALESTAQRLNAALPSALVEPDPVIFARDRLGFKPDPWQADFLRSDAKRILLNCSRQSGKSTTSAVLSLYTALYTPDALVLLISPSLRQSSELFRKVGGFLAHLDQRPVLTEDNKLSLTMANGSRIVSLPSSQGTVRGYSAVTLLIEDEAAQVPDELYRSIRPMLAVSDGRIVLMSTPFGRRGHFFEEWTGEGNWHRVEIPATDCPRISRDFLVEERQSLGPWFYEQEYECQFKDTVDSIFSFETVQAAFDDDVPVLFPDLVI